MQFSETYMKKIVLFVMLSFGCIAFVQAQKMTDDQVVEYVMTAQEKGDSQQQIAADLLHRGVTMDQINRIKRKMDSQGKTGIGQTMDKKNRTRTAPQQNGALQLQSDKEAALKMNGSEREVMMSNELGFLFPDSTMMYMMKEEKRKEIFGHRIFPNKDVAFEAVYNLPTPPNYQLGPGDEVAIDILTTKILSMLDNFK